MANDFGGVSSEGEEVHLSLRPCGLVSHVEDVFEVGYAIELFGHGEQAFDEFLDYLWDRFEVVRGGINQLCIDAVSRGVPLVLTDEHGVAVVLIDSLVDFVGQIAN